MYFNTRLDTEERFSEDAGGIDMKNIGGRISSDLNMYPSEQQGNSG